MEDDVFDLYDDLEEFDYKVKYDEAQTTIESLKKQLQDATKNLSGLQSEKTEMQTRIDNLERSFQSLLTTARSEIKRKNAQIDAIRKEKDDFVFRRKNVLNHVNRQQEYRHDIPPNGESFNPFKKDRNSSNVQDTNYQSQYELKNNPIKDNKQHINRVVNNTINRQLGDKTDTKREHENLKPSENEVRNSPLLKKEYDVNSEVQVVHNSAPSTEFLINQRKTCPHPKEVEKIKNREVRKSSDLQDPEASSRQNACDMRTDEQNPNKKLEVSSHKIQTDIDRSKPSHGECNRERQIDENQTKPEIEDRPCKYTTDKRRDYEERAIANNRHADIKQIRCNSDKKEGTDHTVHAPRQKSVAITNISKSNQREYDRGKSRESVKNQNHKSSPVEGRQVEFNTGKGETTDRRNTNSRSRSSNSSKQNDSKPQESRHDNHSSRRESKQSSKLSEDRERPDHVEGDSERKYRDKYSDRKRHEDNEKGHRGNSRYDRDHHRYNEKSEKFNKQDNGHEKSNPNRRHSHEKSDPKSERPNRDTDRSHQYSQRVSRNAKLHEKNHRNSHREYRIDSENSYSSTNREPKADRDRESNRDKKSDRNDDKSKLSRTKGDHSEIKEKAIEHKEEERRDNRSHLSKATMRPREIDFSESRSTKRIKQEADIKLKSKEKQQQAQNTKETQDYDIDCLSEDYLELMKKQLELKLSEMSDTIGECSAREEKSRSQDQRRPLKVSEAAVISKNLKKDSKNVSKTAVNTHKDKTDKSVISTEQSPSESYRTVAKNECNNPKKTKQTISKSEECVGKVQRDIERCTSEFMKSNPKIGTQIAATEKSNDIPSVSSPKIKHVERQESSNSHVKVSNQPSIKDNVTEANLSKVEKQHCEPCGSQKSIATMNTIEIATNVEATSNRPEVRNSDEVSVTSHNSEAALDSPEISGVAKTTSIPAFSSDNLSATLQSTVSSDSISTTQNFTATNNETSGEKFSSAHPEGFVLGCSSTRSEESATSTRNPVVASDLCLNSLENHIINIENLSAAGAKNLLVERKDSSESIKDSDYQKDFAEIEKRDCTMRSDSNTTDSSSTDTDSLSTTPGDMPPLTEVSLSHIDISPTTTEHPTYATCTHKTAKEESSFPQMQDSAESPRILHCAIEHSPSVNTKLCSTAISAYSDASTNDNNKNKPNENCDNRKQFSADCATSSVEKNENTSLDNIDAKAIEIDATSTPVATSTRVATELLESHSTTSSEDSVSSHSESENLNINNRFFETNLVTNVLPEQKQNIEENLQKNSATTTFLETDQNNTLFSDISVEDVNDLSYSNRFETSNRMRDLFGDTDEEIFDTPIKLHSNILPNHLRNGNIKLNLGTPKKRSFEESSHTDENDVKTKTKRRKTDSVDNERKHIGAPAIFEFNETNSQCKLDKSQRKSALSSETPQKMDPVERLILFEVYGQSSGQPMIIEEHSEFSNQSMHFSSDSHSRSNDTNRSTDLNSQHIISPKICEIPDVSSQCNHLELNHVNDKILINDSKNDRKDSENRRQSMENHKTLCMRIKKNDHSDYIIANSGCKVEKQNDRKRTNSEFVDTSCFLHLKPTKNVISKSDSFEKNMQRKTLEKTVLKTNSQGISQDSVNYDSDEMPLQQRKMKNKNSSQCDRKKGSNTKTGHKRNHSSPKKPKKGKIQDCSEINETRNRINIQSNEKRPASNQVCLKSKASKVKIEHAVNKVSRPSENKNQEKLPHNRCQQSKVDKTKQSNSLPNLNATIEFTENEIGACSKMNPGKSSVPIVNQLNKKSGEKLETQPKKQTKQVIYGLGNNKLVGHRIDGFEREPSPQEINLDNSRELKHELFKEALSMSKRSPIKLNQSPSSKHTKNLSNENSSLKCDDSKQGSENLVSEFGKLMTSSCETNQAIDNDDLTLNCSIKRSKIEILDVQVISQSKELNAMNAIPHDKNTKATYKQSKKTLSQFYDANRNQDTNSRTSIAQKISSSNSSISELDEQSIERLSKPTSSLNPDLSATNISYCRHNISPVKSCDIAKHPPEPCTAVMTETVESIINPTSSLQTNTNSSSRDHSLQSPNISIGNYSNHSSDVLSPSQYEKRNISLASSNYVIEQVDSNVVNVFITRKRGKKKQKYG